MELLLIIGLVIVFSGLSFLFKLIGIGFKLFWILFVGAFTLLGYILTGLVSLLFPVFAIIFLIKLFEKKE